MATRKKYGGHGVEKMLAQDREARKQRELDWVRDRSRDGAMEDRSIRRIPGDVSANLFTDEQSEVLRAILKFRSTHHRPPRLIEGFRIIRSLGWCKT